MNFLLTYNPEIHYTPSLKRDFYQLNISRGPERSLASANNPMKHTIASFRDSRINLKVMIGNGQIDEQVCQYIDADAYRRDAIAAVSLNKE